LRVSHDRILLLVATGELYECMVKIV